MDAEVLATEEIVKIEMEDVEADTKLFELYNASWNLSFKRETDENTKNAVSVRIPVPEITDQINFKSEPEEEVKVESCLDNSEKYSVLEIMEEFVIKNECNDDDMFFNTTTEAVSNRIPVPEITDFLKSEPEVVKVESCLDNSEKYSVLEIKEEFIIKDEYNDDDMFVDTSIETVSNSVLKQQPVECKKLSRNLVYCHICDYSARYKYILVRHMKEHRNLNEHGSSYKHNTCIHCNAKFRSKRSLDDHVIKQHSDLVESVSSKTHKCSHCAYKSTNNGNYRRHMLKHSKTARASNYKFGIFICTHCNAKFKRKCTLYDHIIREHPDFISSLSCKLHHCTRCAYTTTIKSRLARHMLFKHSESVGNYKLIICIHCNAKFKTKMVLDNHIIKEHPDCIASVSSRIFECEYCEYKTTMKNHLASHTLKHPESVCKFSICIHCNAKFKFKHRLNNHIIKEHPEFIASISARIHECTHCAYKTTFKTRFSEHMLKHPETADNYKFKICIHCNAKLKSTRILNDHIVRRHPEFIATVSAEIHECSHCSYKTTIKAQFSEHMLKHPETVDNFKFLVCIHCKATFKDKTGLDNHLIKKHPDFIASVSSKIHECKHCEYKTIFKTNLTRHVMKHPETVDNSKFLICNHCKATFKCKRGLNNHLINKHPDFIASVSCKIHECTHCAYKTIQKSVIDKHMSKHSKLVDNYKFKICIHCNAKLKSTRTLNDHIVRRHPEFIASVSAKIHECACCAYKTVIKANLVKHMKKKHGTYRKKSDMNDHIVEKHPEFVASLSDRIHECTHCAYKTTDEAQFSEHMLNHLETVDKSKSGICIHCKAKFQGKTRLDNHLIKKHPDFIASVSSKIHECKHCEYKTTIKTDLTRHMMKHPETVDPSKFLICVHCKATFKCKRGLNNHLINKHPDSIASVSSKIHECLNCAYKTIFKSSIAKHVLEHSESEGDSKFDTCIHCSAAFKSKHGLNNHIIKKHPEFISSVSSKIYECTHCSYKTTFKSLLARHMLQHPELVDNYKFSICIHCNAKFRSKVTLNDHLIKKHPDFIASVSSKIYECTYCAHKTTHKSNLDRHMSKHSELVDDDKFGVCIHCNAKLKSTRTLNDHIVKKHPEFIASVSAKIHECTCCAYKTVIKAELAKHMKTKHHT